MDRRNFAFNKTNFILLAIGMVIVILGFILMAGGGSTESHFDAEIFNATRIKVAPMVCLFGFILLPSCGVRRTVIQLMDNPNFCKDSSYGLV